MTKGVQMQSKEGLIDKNRGSTAVKTMKNSFQNLYNRFFICNTFLLHVLYLHATFHHKIIHRLRFALSLDKTGL